MYFLFLFLLFFSLQTKNTIVGHIVLFLHQKPKNNLIMENKILSKKGMRKKKNDALWAHWKAKNIYKNVFPTTKLIVIAISKILKRK